MSAEEEPPSEPIRIPIEESLDLHGIPPAEVKEVVLEYLRLAREKGFFRVRLIHGKGLRQMQQTVHAVLRGYPDVSKFSQAPEGLGSWGATLVWLRPATTGH